MNFRVSITRRGEPRPFWTKTVSTQEDADRVARKNQHLIDREKWNHAITIEEVPVKSTKIRKSDDDAKAMAAYVAMFSSIEDSLAFEKAALAAPNVHLPPCARSVRDGGQRIALYWRWLHVLAEVWS